MNDVEIDYSTLVQVYKNRMSDLIHQNVLLETRGNLLAQKVNSLQEKITELEGRKSSGTRKKQAVNTAQEDFT
tara:strand:+ start:190 stop:408 length:219 start_codon:yes stop_codon:yes gene_type:complete